MMTQVLRFVSALAFAAALTTSALAQDDRKSAVLNEIRYFGIGHVPASAIEKALPFTVGDIWKENYIELGRAVTKEYLRRRGFFSASVDVKAETLSEGILYILKINEGPPCTIKSVGISEPQNIERRASLKRFMRGMYKTLNMEAGERFDGEKLQDQLRVLHEHLMKEDYIQANTEKVRLRFAPDNSSVDIDVSVQYGDLVTFGFMGNTVFSRGDLNEIMAVLKATDLGKDYVGVLLRKFTDEYKARGYANVTISPIYSEGDRGKRIIFSIHEGDRVQIAGIRFEGLAPQNRRSTTDSFYRGSSRLVQRGYFVERDVDSGIQSSIEFLKSSGYLTAKLVSRTLVADKDGAGVSIMLQFFEGERTLIGEVRVIGANNLGEANVMTRLGLKSGSPFNPYHFEESLQKLRGEYVAQGFMLSRVAPEPAQVVRFSDRNRRVDIRIDVEEGPRIKVGDIRVEGLTKTKRHVVMREVEIKTGQWWLAKDVFALDDSLRRLGIFTEVKIRPQSSALGSDYRDLLIEVREGEPGLVEFGPGFRSDLGFRGFARVGYNNLFGRGYSAALSGDTNRRIGGTFPYQFVEYGLQSSLIDPRFLGTRNGLSFGLNTSRRQFIDFNAMQTQLSVAMDRKLFVPQLLGKLTYRLERIRQFGAPDAIDNQTLLIGSITPMVAFDTRDSPFMATRGQITTLSYEYAQPVLATRNIESSSAVGYYKWTAGTHFYVPLPLGIVWSNVVSGGHARSLISNQIPLIKTFRLGGYASIRGFTEDSINRDKFAIFGSLSFINLRTQFEMPLAGDLKMAPFIDAGNLFLDVLRAAPFLRVGAGLGLHYMTPIGPINFDYGMKINRRADEKAGQFHFSVGII